MESLCMLRDTRSLHQQGITYIISVLTSGRSMLRVAFGMVMVKIKVPVIASGRIRIESGGGFGDESQLGRGWLAKDCGIDQRAPRKLL